MKVLFWNLGYSRNIDGSLSSHLKNVHKFLRIDVNSQQKTLDKVIEIVQLVSPDVFAYAEVQTGSFANREFDQHAYLAEKLSGILHEDAVTKYGDTILSSLPYHKGNSNGVITTVPASIKNHLLLHSSKKLVQIVTLHGVTIFVVHLPLLSKDRRLQIKELSGLINNVKGEVVVIGDFNIMNGYDELHDLQRKTDLKIAGEGVVTFPSYKPKMALDICLYRLEKGSKQPNFTTISSLESDHLPIVFEM